MPIVEIDESTSYLTPLERFSVNMMAIIFHDYIVPFENERLDAFNIILSEFLPENLENLSNLEKCYERMKDIFECMLMLTVRDRNSVFKFIRRNSKHKSNRRFNYQLASLIYYFIQGQDNMATSAFTRMAVAKRVFQESFSIRHRNMFSALKDLCPHLSSNNHFIETFSV